MKRNEMEYRTGLGAGGWREMEGKGQQEEEVEGEGKGCSISSRLAQCPGCDLLPETVSRGRLRGRPERRALRRRRLPILNKR